MTITNHPLHRSGRALLTHPAPALGDDAKSPQWIRVMESRPWQPTVNQSVHPLPRKPLPLAPPPKRAVPVSCDLEAKRSQRVQVRWNTIIPVVSFYHAPKPFTYFGHSLMHPFSKFQSDFLQLSAFPLAHRSPMHREHPVASLLATDVREAKKIECLRLPLSTPFSIVGCMEAKLDQARFLGMKLQVELGESLRQLSLKPLGVRPVLKSHDEVIGPADDDNVAFGSCLPPVLHPEVEHVVQIDVGHQRRGVASPILANVYLHYVLDLWVEVVVKANCRGKAFLIRYADDFVCAFQYEEDAEQFYKVLELRLQEFGLQLAADKTRVIKFARWDKSGTNRFDFLGFEFHWGLDRNGKDRIERRTSRKKLRISLRNFSQWCRANRDLPISRLLLKLNLKLRGYYNYYAVTGNFESIKEFYEQAKRILLKWLNRRSQRRSFNWQGFSDLLNHFKVPRPRIVHTPARIADRKAALLAERLTRM